MDPSSGYETASVAAITADRGYGRGRARRGPGYSFVMPAEAVIIDVSFQLVRN
ncbi:MAG: hypothetical protein ACLTSG_13665 [Lachnospiraceae bacterium]